MGSRDGKCGWGRVDPSGAIQAVVAVFGIAVASGLDDVLHLAPKVGGISAFAMYVMALSVVARFSLGAAIHLAIEHVNRPADKPWQDAGLKRAALAVDLVAFASYGVVIRIGASIGDPQGFMVGQVVLFSLSLLWGMVAPLWHKWSVGDWRFWRAVDFINLLGSAAAALAIKVYGAEPLVITVSTSAACLLYLYLGYIDVRCLLQVADASSPTKWWGVVLLGFQSCEQEEEAPSGS